jgi:DNA-binding NarL/FixJ family response regulator
MPRVSGPVATRQIKAEMPEVKVVMLTVSSDDQDLFEAVRAGASGYLLKTLKVGEFWARLSQIVEGGVALAPGMTARLMAGIAQLDGPPNIPALAADLSPQQCRVLQLVAQGMTYKEVGAALHLSEHTIKYHMEQIMARLHMATRAEVLAYARRIGLSQPPK